MRTFLHRGQSHILFANILFVGWVLSGKFTVNRFLEALIGEIKDWPIIEIRWILAITTIYLIRQIFLFQWPKSIIFRLYTAMVLTFFSVLCFSTLYHPLNDFRYLFDILDILLQIWILACLAQNNRNFGVVTAIMVTVLGYLFLIFFLLGIGTDPEKHGLGFHAFGGIYTFHRIQFLSVASLIYLATKTERNLYAGTLVFAAIPNLTGIFLCFSKAAVMFSVACLCWGAFLFLFKRKYEFVVFIAILLSISGTLFLMGENTDYLASRVEQAYSIESIGEEFSISLSYYKDPSSSYYPSGNLSETFFKYCTHVPSETDKTLKYNVECKIKKFSDWSGRLIFLAESLSLISEAKLLGGGPGRLMIVGQNQYTGVKTITVHPHNIFVEVLLATGIVGGVPFFLGICMGFLPFLNVDKLQLGNIPVSLALLYVLAIAQFSGDIYDFRLYWLLATGLLLSPNTRS